MTTNPQTPMELKVEPVAQFWPVQDDKPAAEPWRNDLTLHSVLGDARLGDSDTDHVLWCDKFRLLRDTMRVPVQAAIAVLRLNLPKATHWDIGNIDSEWRQRGTSPRQTQQEWEEFLSFSLELIAAQACRGYAPTKQSLNDEWEARQFASNILQLADKFKRLDTPIVKSIHDKFVAGANPPLRNFLGFAEYLMPMPDQQPRDEACRVFQKLVIRAATYEATVVKCRDIHPPGQSPRISASSSRANTEVRTVPPEQILYLTYASGHNCYGNKCER